VNGYTYTASASLLLGFIPIGYYQLNGFFNLGSGILQNYPFDAVVVSSSLTYYPTPRAWSALSNGWCGDLEFNFSSKSATLTDDNNALPYGAPAAQESGIGFSLVSRHVAQYLYWNRGDGQVYTALVDQSGISAYGQFTAPGYVDPYPVNYTSSWAFHLTLSGFLQTSSEDLECVLSGNWVLLANGVPLVLSLSYTNPTYPCNKNDPSIENPNGGTLTATLTSTSNVKEILSQVEIFNRHWGWYVWFVSTTVNPGTYSGIFDSYLAPHGIHGHYTNGNGYYHFDGTGPF